MAVRAVPDGDEKQAVYIEALRALTEAGELFLVGGAYALFDYLGRWRSTKDMDVFIEPERVERALSTLRSAGFDVEVLDAAWLAKARRGPAFIDVVFCSYNGLFPVDRRWFENARSANLLGVDVQIVGPEEIIVSKAFVAARDRFDGADISWLIRALGPTLDWRRIEQLMGDHWQVLLWQLVHFMYVFPSERRVIPADLMARLMARLGRELIEAPPESLRCRGPMLDPVLYWTEIRGQADGDPRPRRELVAAQLGCVPER
jgi:hypothetical protein